MITTVTLNAAIDKTYIVDDLQLGQVVRVKECIQTAGGKGINVSKIVSLAGEKLIATGFIGGYSGKFIEEQMALKNIETNFIHVKGETRFSTNIINKNTGEITELLEAGAEINNEDKEKLLGLLEDLSKNSQVMTISGSAPMGIEDDIYQEIIKIAKKNENKVILDTSGKLLEKGILACPTMIKPNIDEMRVLTGSSMDSLNDIIAGARELYQQGIEIVAVSLGADGVVVVCDEGVYHAIPPKLKAVNTVGCGDSMVAGFAIGLKKKYPMEKTIRLAVAVSAANALTMEAGYYIKEDMEKIHEQIRVYNPI